MGHVGWSGLGTMRGWAYRFCVGGKMLELNLQAISVQRAIDGALEKLLYVQTKENFKIFDSKARSKIFQKMRYSTYNRISKYFQSPLLSFGPALDSVQNSVRKSGWTLNPTLEILFANEKNFHTLMKLEFCFNAFLCYYLIICLKYANFLGIFVFKKSTIYT